jgi:hypothetical protein
MVEDVQLRMAERMEGHLAQVEKTTGQAPPPPPSTARWVRRHGSGEGVQGRPTSSANIQVRGHQVLQGHVSRPTYNSCLGLLAGGAADVVVSPSLSVNLPNLRKCTWQCPAP